MYMKEIKKKAFKIKNFYLNFIFWKKLGFFLFLFFLNKTEYLTLMSAVLRVTSYRLQKNGKFRLRAKGRWIIEEERLDISSTLVIPSWLRISLWTNHKLYTVTFYVNWTRDPFVNGYQSVRELSHPTVGNQLSIYEFFVMIY